jgi:hypothetical protein
MVTRLRGLQHKCGGSWANFADELALILLHRFVTLIMLAKTLAAWLILIAVLPFTAPFSSVTVANVFGSRPSKHRGLAAQARSRSCSTDVAGDFYAEVGATDLATGGTGADVRPVTAWRHDTPLTPAHLAGVPAAAAPIDARATWIDTLAVHERRLVQRPSVLRL